MLPIMTFSVNSHYQHKYVIIFLDDFTSHAWAACLCQKLQAITATKQFLAMVETQYQTKVMGWMSDAGGEYKSVAFDTLLRNCGIEILQPALYTSQQNGHAERFMHTMMDKAKTMRFTACIPPS